jgi:hypothetical protein
MPSFIIKKAPPLSKRPTSFLRGSGRERHEAAGGAFEISHAIFFGLLHVLFSRGASKEHRRGTTKETTTSLGALLITSFSSPTSLSQPSERLCLAFEDVLHLVKLKKGRQRSFRRNDVLHFCIFTIKILFWDVLVQHDDTLFFPFANDPPALCFLPFCFTLKRSLSPPVRRSCVPVCMNVGAFACNNIFFFFCVRAFVAQSNDRGGLAIK